MKFLRRTFFVLICLALVFAVTAAPGVSAERMKLIPGGMSFGVKFFTDGAVVVGITGVETNAGLVCPASDSGISVRDVITAVNGKKLASAEDLIEAIRGGNGSELKLSVTDTDGNLRDVAVTPAKGTDGVYRIGVWVRDSTAGIGTVTFISAENGFFGGLGHAICDVDTGIILPVGKAYVVDVDITSIVKGREKTPGELKGTFGTAVKGEIITNCEVGVFGTYTDPPESLREPMEVGKASELMAGDATVLCAVDGTVKEYGIEIVKIYKDSGNTKNFLIEVTDPELLKLTGGIVQGMSGSPIIQNGRIVGAVTHVLVNNHTRGYGIHIENMLSGSSQ